MMASGKERARWERWYDQVTARLERQKKAINRLIAIQTETVAALSEIAAMESGHDTVLDGAIERAQEALERIGAAAAAEHQSHLESEAEQDPIEDPRSNK